MDGLILFFLMGIVTLLILFGWVYYQDHKKISKSAKKK